MYAHPQQTGRFADPAHAVAALRAHDVTWRALAWLGEDVGEELTRSQLPAACRSAQAIDDHVE